MQEKAAPEDVLEEYNHAFRRGDFGRMYDLWVAESNVRRTNREEYIRKLGFYKEKARIKLLDSKILDVKRTDGRCIIRTSSKVKSSVTGVVENKEIWTLINTQDGWRILKKEDYNGDL